MKQHPTTEALLAYPMGELETETARSVFEHCNSCPECGAELAMIISLRATVVAAERPDARTWPWLAVAASVLLLIAMGIALANLGVGFLPMRAWTGTVGDEPPGPRTEVSPGQPDYASLATRETLPQAHVNFRFGLAMPASANQGMLRQGVQAIVDERFDDAEWILQQLHEIRPDDTEVSVYLGVAKYFQGDVSEETAARLRLEPPTDSLGRAGHWYLGNLLLARGELQQARLVLDSLVGADDRWGRRAQELLQAIDRS